MQKHVGWTAVGFCACVRILLSPSGSAMGFCMPIDVSIGVPRAAVLTASWWNGWWAALRCLLWTSISNIAGFALGILPFGFIERDVRMASCWSRLWRNNYSTCVLQYCISMLPMLHHPAFLTLPKAVSVRTRKARRSRNWSTTSRGYLDIDTTG